MDMTNLRSRFNVLIDELVSQGYCKIYIRRIKRHIKLAIELGSHETISCYQSILELATKKLGIVSCGIRYNIVKRDFAIIEDFDLNGNCPRHRKSSIKLESLIPCFKDLVLNHKIIGFQGVNGTKREHTVQNEYYMSIQFLSHLQEHGAKSLTTVKALDVYSFFFDGDKEVRGVDCCKLVRAFLSHIGDRDKEAAQRIIELLPRISKRRRLYNGLTKEEGEKILKALEDMENGLSLRDRAIGFLLYFYGLRGTDISQLTLDDIDWRNNQIVIIQSKTSTPLSLPLEPIVGNAIFSYLKELRMNQSDTTRVIFLKNNGTEPPLSLKNIVYHIFDVAGVRQEEGPKGFRPMRHYFATSLLCAGEKCEVIAKLLGHSDIKTLDRYADTNYHELKKCSLSISMFPINPEIFKI